MHIEIQPAITPKKHSTPEERNAVIEQWQASGLTQKAFCRSQSINSKTFASWLKVYRLNQKAELNKGKAIPCTNKFAALTPAANPIPIAPVIIRLSSGNQITLAPSTPMPFIKQLIDLLER